MMELGFRRWDHELHEDFDENYGSLGGSIGRMAFSRDDDIPGGFCHVFLGSHMGVTKL